MFTYNPSLHFIERGHDSGTKFCVCALHIALRCGHMETPLKLFSLRVLLIILQNLQKQTLLDSRAFPCCIFISTSFSHALQIITLSSFTVSFLNTRPFSNNSSDQLATRRILNMYMFHDSAKLIYTYILIHFFIVIYFQSINSFWGSLD